MYFTDFSYLFFLTAPLMTAKKFRLVEVYTGMSLQSNKINHKCLSFLPTLIGLTKIQHPLSQAFYSTTGNSHRPKLLRLKSSRKWDIYY